MINLIVIQYYLLLILLHYLQIQLNHLFHFHCFFFLLHHLLLIVQLQFNFFTIQLFYFLRIQYQLLNFIYHFLIYYPKIPIHIDLKCKFILCYHLLSPFFAIIIIIIIIPILILISIQS